MEEAAILLLLLRPLLDTGIGRQGVGGGRVACAVGGGGWVGRVEEREEEEVRILRTLWDHAVGNVSPPLGQAVRGKSGEGKRGEGVWRQGQGGPLAWWMPKGARAFKVTSSACLLLD